MSLRAIKLLVIDNFDSFTYNLAHLIADVTGNLPDVIQNTYSLTLDDLSIYDAIIISPGPGNPSCEEDIGVSRFVLDHFDGPILGVCLGAQYLGCYYGATVQVSDDIYHGRRSSICFDDSQLNAHSLDPLFKDIPDQFQAVRYHSLYLPTPLPETLIPLAWSDDDVLMAFKHESKSLYGVQFHPESILTDYGKRLVENFICIVQKERSFSNLNANLDAKSNLNVDKVLPYSKSAYSVLTTSFSCDLDSETIFDLVYKQSDPVFWLDSELFFNDGALSGSNSRFSYMGDLKGPNSRLITYDSAEKKVSVWRLSGEGLLLDDTLDDTFDGTVFDYLDMKLGSIALQEDDSGLPFEFRGGYVGYFGYECKDDLASTTTHTSSYPDAQFIFADRCLVVDHLEHKLYLMCLIESSSSTDGAMAWFESVQSCLTSHQVSKDVVLQNNNFRFNGQFVQSKTKYLEDLEACIRELRLGESYEICLTNRFFGSTTMDPYTYYRRLRCQNPAPYASFFRLKDIQIASSSPEQFLSLSSSGTLESKPIKGTVRRGDDWGDDSDQVELLRDSVKNQSENLMIVDLVRHEFSRVCDVGSVVVSELMAIQTYPSVHHMVSTIKGQKSSEKSVVDCVRATFPGGSMTGAPKLRTMSIIDQVETTPRGVYAGSIGYISLNGSLLLNIVIRTAVFEQSEHGYNVSIGTGGAVTVLSSVEEEYDEMILKSTALISCFESEFSLVDETLV